MKKIALALSLVSLSFLVGYGAVAEAYPGGGVWGRAANRGYFHNNPDYYGGHVFPSNSNTSGCPASGGNAIPTYINTASEFIAFIKCKLYSTNGSIAYRNQERAGAAFIIQTMTHPMNAPNYDKTPDASVITDWENRVNAAAARGSNGVQFGVDFTYSINSYYQGTGTGSNPIDDAFYDDNARYNSIVFKNNAGTIIYGIKHLCANPVGNGNFGQLERTNPFDVDASTSVNDSTPNPGQTITFTHTLSTDATTSPATINWTTQNMPSGATVASGNTGAIAVGTPENVGTENYTVPPNAAAGSQICRRVAFNPENHNGGSDVSATRCATVNRVFNLIPNVQPSASYAQVGDAVTFTYRITNPGPHDTASPLSVCKAVAKIHPPGSPLPEQFADRTSDAGLTTPAMNCPTPIRGNNTPVVVGTENVTIGNLPIGARVCRSLVINPYNNSGGTFRASAEACVVVAKTPFVRFMGGDVWAGGGFSAVTPACNTSAKITTVGRPLAGTSPMQYAGSMVEYQAFALNRVTGFGSASRVMTGAGVIGSPVRAMTYGNNEADVNLLGYFGAAQHCMDDYSTEFGSLPPPLGIVPGTSSPNSGAWRITGSISLGDNSPVPAGSSKVYYVQGNVDIVGNIPYVGTYTSPSRIPNVMVIATGDIRVRAGVTRMDGIYVSRGTFYTCYPKIEPLDNNTCSNMLTVNGAVKATRVDLHRTAGSEGMTVVSRQAPAEVFYFSPELYLSNGVDGGNRTTVETTNLIELPPRF